MGRHPGQQLQTSIACSLGMSSESLSRHTVREAEEGREVGQETE